MHKNFLLSLVPLPAIIIIIATISSGAFPTSPEHPQGIQAPYVTILPSPVNLTPVDAPEVTEAPLAEPAPALPSEPKKRIIKLTIAGDCMLASYKGNGGFAKKAAEGDYEWFLSGVTDIFREDDFTIVNLENVLTDRPLPEVSKDHSPAYWYKAPTANTQILTASSVEVVNLSNNHTNDYGKQGQEDTKAACDAAGLLWGDSGKTVYLEKDGFTIALICNGLWWEGQEQQIINRLEEAIPHSDFQIVYYHGGKERIHTPEQWKIRASHRIVDAGADLVIGNHPHVLQPRETYNGVDIVYSMGNFCYGGSNKCENRTILYTLELEVDKNNSVIAMASDIIPCYVYGGDTNNWRPEVIQDETQIKQVLAFMRGDAESPL